MNEFKKKYLIPGLVGEGIFVVSLILAAICGHIFAVGSTAGTICSSIILFTVGIVATIVAAFSTYVVGCSTSPCVIGNVVADLIAYPLVAILIYNIYLKHSKIQ